MIGFIKLTKRELAVKALARTFQPTVKSEDIEIDVIQNLFQNLLGKNIAASHLIAVFLPAENDPKALEELTPCVELHSAGTKWVYAEINGQIYRRLYDITNQCWIGDRELCP
ncbi:MAG: hypothetical protein K2L86_11590 [Lachnospiraceae bacterium]|nr:hypothetical protein [Lachnospiraceae bacterium]